MKIIKINKLENILENISAKKVFTNENIEIIEITLMPKETIPIHKNDVRALFNIIEGKGIVTVNNEEFHVEKGDFLEIEKGLDRKWINYGDSPLVIIVTKLMN
jgi:quercetin dioxygenase-like cupin family protein